MSSTNQAFVKAYARRNRSQRQAGPESGRPAEGVSPTVDQPGSLDLDQSVANSASIWLESVDNQIARADAPEANVRPPRVDEPSMAATQPGQANIEKDSTVESRHDAGSAGRRGASMQSLQHIHTAYAAGVSDLDLGYVETASAVSMPSNSTLSDRREHVPVKTSSTDAADGREAEAACQAETDAAAEVTELRIDAPESKPLRAHRQAETLVPFQAVWEVDVFDIPTLVADLFFDAALFQQIAERMGEAVGTGLSSVLVTSAKQGEGRSSAAIGIAMAAAAAGIRVALVDADTENPTLADDLHLDLQYGWVDAIRGGLPIKEVAVHAVEDGLTLIPLMPPHGPNAASADEVVQLIERLRNKFELIIIDGPSASSSSAQQCASIVDTAIIVRDMTRTDAAAIDELSYRLRESGVRGVGVVENFA